MENGINGSSAQSLIIAKSKAYIDATSGKSAQEIYDNFIAGIDVSTISENQIVYSFYNVLMQAQKPLNLFDLLETKYPNQLDMILQSKISLYTMTNQPKEQTSALIKRYYDTFGETRYALVTELEFLIANNFENPTRQQELLDKISKIDQEAKNAV